MMKETFMSTMNIIYLIRPSHSLNKLAFFHISGFDLNLRSC